MVVKAADVQRMEILQRKLFDAIIRARASRCPAAAIVRDSV